MSLHQSYGSAAARLLAGSWRDTPPPLDLRALSAIAEPALLPLLYQAGAAALLLRAARPGELSPAIDQALRRRHRQQVLDEMLHLHHAEQVVTTLREVGIDPLLIKGWSVARRYPAPGLRPFRDVDIVVEPHQREPALRALRRLPIGIEVDLHDRVRYFAGRDARAVQARRRRVSLRGLDVQVLGPEDEIVLLCRHALEHGAWRALALIDVALLLEQRDPAFDWDYLLADSARSAREVICVLQLLRTALSARIDHPAIDSAPPPRWLLPALYVQWGRPYQVPLAMPRWPRSPSALVAEARSRVHDPISATANAGPWNDLPRLPFQLLDLGLRAARYLRHGPRWVLGHAPSSGPSESDRLL